MIPEFNDQGFLPPGHHWSDWNEFVTRFSGHEHRKTLLKGLHQMLNLLGFADCREVRIGGSFVSAKLIPGDFDGVWMKQGVQRSKLPLEIDASYLAQPDIFGGTIVSEGMTFTDLGLSYLFQDVLEQTKQNQPVGVILLDPRAIPLAQPFPRYAHFFAAAG